ncbi:hypothetical protein L7F22_009863 [Adiantum nelumboides]|nr:hypothetical protein [Adiantum nelumboides]
MPRRPNPLWAEHTNVLRVVNTSGQAGSGTRTWVCKYCGEQMTSTINRVLKHLTGIGTTGHCGGCEAVPPALRDALILEHFPPGSTASSQSGGAHAAAIAAEDALQDALLGNIGGSTSALPSFAGTSRKRARVSQAEDEGASASAASTACCTFSSGPITSLYGEMHPLGVPYYDQFEVDSFDDVQQILRFRVKLSFPDLQARFRVPSVERETANKRMHGTRILAALPVKPRGGHYPLEDGNDPGNIEEFTPFSTKSNSFSASSTSPAKTPVFSGPLHCDGLTLEGNALPGSALGLPEVGNSKDIESVNAVGDKVALQDNQQNEETFLIPPQISIYNGNGGNSKEFSGLQFHVNSTLPGYHEAGVPGCDSRIHLESQHASVHTHKSQDSDFQNPVKLSSQNNIVTSTIVKAKASEHSFPHNSNPASRLIDSYFSYHGWLQHLGGIQTGVPGPTHEHLTYPWQFMQAPCMNHPSAFAAAMAAAVWAMRETGSNMNQSLSPENLNAAVFAAASASWWALNGLVQHAHNPLAGGASRPSNVQRTGDDTSTHEQQVMGEKHSGAKEKTALPSRSPETYKAQGKLCSEKMSCNLSDMAEQSGPSADDFDTGEHTTGEGSSSGSNTPALLSNLSEQEIPSLSENDNAENIGLCVLVDDGRKRAFQALVGDGCIKLKAKTSERGRSQLKDSRQGEHDNGKRLKSCGHETDSRKVSSQGRRAFEALFTSRMLPQTFTREAERSDDPSPSLAEVITSNETNWSSECTLMTESNELKTSFLQPSRRTSSDVDMLRTGFSLDKPRASMSGFIPYQKFI